VNDALKKCCEAFFCKEEGFAVFFEEKCFVLLQNAYLCGKLQTIR